jgi:hypothetical protein
MKRELEEFKTAAARLIAVWDDDRVVHYPATLPSFDELVSRFAETEALDPDEALRRILAGNPDRGRRVDRDPSGAVYVYGTDVRGAYVGVDHGINGTWQVYLYWPGPGGDAQFTAVDLGSEGLDVGRKVAKKLRPLLEALR